MPCNGKKCGDDDVITTTTENVSTGDEQTAKPTTSGKRQPAAAVRQRPQLGQGCSAIHVQENCIFWRHEYVTLRVAFDACERCLLLRFDVVC